MQLPAVTHVSSSSQSARSACSSSSLIEDLPDRCCALPAVCISSLDLSFNQIRVITNLNNLPKLTSARHTAAAAQDRHCSSR